MESAPVQHRYPPILREEVQRTCPASIVQWRRNQNEIADMFLLQELALCISNPFEGKHLGHEGPYLAALDVADEVREHRLVPRRAADERDVLEIHVAHVEVDDRPGEFPRVRDSVVGRKHRFGYLTEVPDEAAQADLSQAAGALGLSRSALYRRLQRYGL